MMRPRDESGFSLVDLLVAIGIVGVVAASAIPMGDSMAQSFRIKGDAQAIANTVSLAKMRAAAQFTRTRIRADLTTNTFQLEVWDKGAARWFIDGGVVRLSRAVTFGFGGLAAPPPNTQNAIGQSPACTGTDALTGNTIGNSACIVFNSRGVPIDNTLAGAPVGGNGFYITDGSSVYATTVTATPLVRQWWSNAGNAAWVQQ